MDDPERRLEVEQAADLRKRVDDVMATAATEQDRARALLEIVKELQARRVAVRVCAWCGSVNVGGSWYAVALSTFVDDLGGGYADTHGICPDCFDVEAHGLTYPG